MEFGVGSILEGKVTSITKFGAFVSLGDNKSGLVHISEIANTYVNDIHDHLQEGQSVKVKVLAIDENGRINLSIKRAAENPAPRGQQPAARSGGFERRALRPRQGGRMAQSKQPRDPASLTFEDKLKMFMADSESRMADIRHNTDRKSGSRRRK